ncbi:MAG: hypothetical protein QXS27_04140 [Candidatus Jordarchaeaceae archaeon]
MKGKLKMFAASILIVLTLSLGTSYLTLGTGAFANNNYYPVGLVYAALEWQMKTSAPDLPSNLNFPIDLDIEVLTLEQIELYKHSIEDAMNNAFMKWQIQKIRSGELKPFTSPPDNESVRNLFFQFLSQNPDCAARFAQYDQMLSRENQLRISERVSELKQSLQDIKLIMQQGEIISELNETKNINGTNYYIVTREYSLTINGTTQNVIKITVTANDGRVILDPYFRIDQAPLLWPCYVWVFWPFVFIGWWFTVILYGYDYYMYAYWTSGLEASAWISYVYLNLPIEGVWTYIQWAGLIGSLVGGIYWLISTTEVVVVPEVIAASIQATLGVTAIVLSILIIGGWVWQEHVIDRYQEVASYNLARNPNWGWMECTYIHNPTSPPRSANPPCFDESFKIIYYLVSVDGAFWHKLPVDFTPAPGTPMYNDYLHLVYEWNLVYGFNHWVWISAGEAPCPPPW